jgi:hypothetical protein
LPLYFLFYVGKMDGAKVSLRSTDESRMEDLIATCAF